MKKRAIIELVIFIILLCVILGIIIAYLPGIRPEDIIVDHELLLFGSLIILGTLFISMYLGFVTFLNSYIKTKAKIYLVNLIILSIIYLTEIFLYFFDKQNLILNFSSLEAYFISCVSLIFNLTYIILFRHIYRLISLNKSGSEKENK